MAPADIDTLEKRYFDFCFSNGVVPNATVLSSLLKAKMKKACQEATILVVVLDHLKDVDYLPLLRLFMEIDISEIEGVDIINTSLCAMTWENVLTLLHAVNDKLRVVHLQDIFFDKSPLLDIAQQGLSCQVLNLRSYLVQTLNLEGMFLQLHTLNLDFSASLTNLSENCFSCMPNLRFLSLCETRISNLWTTSASLVKLPSLSELRFQNFSCRDISMCCSLSSERNPHLTEASVSTNSNDEMVFDTCHASFCQTNYSSDGSSDYYSSDAFLDLQNQNSLGMEIEEGDTFLPSLFRSGLIPRNYRKMSTGDHASPICYENHYREYMISYLPNLKVLDDLPIRKNERDMARVLSAQHFEYLPYKRKIKENVFSILSKREIRANHASYVGTSQYSYSRSLSAARMDSSAWPVLRPVFRMCRVSRDERRSFRPRQLEYHPCDSSLMVFGTLDGEVVVVNHESEKLVRYLPSLGSMSCILGLCWLRKYPLKLIAGSDNGSLRLYDINHMSRGTSAFHSGGGSVIFDDFDQLTSVHVNSTDELFLASGYSKNVGLYDISSGKRLQVFTDMHREHINVIKFSNHSPSVFATSSFDHDVKMWDLRQNLNRPCYTTTNSRGNVMVCFSPDDQYLLVSAVDNEVKQLLAVDGRVHLDFDIISTGSSQNYTRSYYMNGKDYVISGSCDEHVVRICCAQTGRRLRDITLEGKGTGGASMFVQSLRGDPFRDFNLSVLAAYIHPSSNPEIVKVNLLSSNEQEKESWDCLSSGRSLGFGG